MGKKNETRGRKRKSTMHNPKLQTSPPAKRRMSVNATRGMSEERTDEQHAIQEWLRQSRQTPALETTVVPPAPPSENSVIVHADIHPEPESGADNCSDIDAIDIALDIAKDAASVKCDIRRIERIIMSNKDAQIREHNTLIELLTSIQDHVEKIDKKSDRLEEKINTLSNKLNIQEQGLSKAQHDIETLFKSISNLESKPNATSVNTKENTMEVDDKPWVQNENCIVVSNLPDCNHDEEDVMALFYVGLSLPINDAEIKNITRNKSKNEGPGHVTVELEKKEHKINVLRKKRDLRFTNEYHNVFIRPVKSQNEINMERNFSAILKNMPLNHNLMMASNGKIVTRNENKYEQ